MCKINKTNASLRTNYILIETTLDQNLKYQKVSIQRIVKCFVFLNFTEFLVTLFESLPSSIYTFSLSTYNIAMRIGEVFFPFLVHLFPLLSCIHKYAIKRFFPCATEIHVYLVLC